MSNLWSILKITFINNLGLNAIINKNLSKEDKNKSLKTLGMMLLMGGVLLFVVSVYANLIAEGLESINLLYILPMAASLITVVFVFFTSIYKAAGTIFISKDYDFLMSLPIDNKEILTSKLIELLSFNIGISAIIMIPSTIVYFMRSNSSPFCFLFMIIGIFILPLIPIIFASLFAFVISFISSKVRFSKIALALGTVILFIGIFLASYKVNDFINYIVSKSDTLTKVFQGIYPPSSWFADSLVNNNLISLGKFLLISLIPFIIFIIIFGKQFKKINSKLSESYKKSDYKISTLKINSVSTALLKTEFKKYFSSVSYVINTLLSPIMLIIMSIASAVTGGNVVLSVLPKEMSGFLSIGIAGISSLIIGIGVTTFSTISIEGKCFWILKTLPVSIIEIFKAKILVYIILCVPAILLSGVVFMIALQISLIDTVLIVATVILFTLLISIIGLLINLNYPKFEWKQEIQAVKNTVSVTIGLFTSLAIIGACALVFYLLKPENTVLFIGSIDIILIIGIIVAWKVLGSIGTKIFKRL